MFTRGHCVFVYVYTHSRFAVGAEKLDATRMRILYYLYRYTVYITLSRNLFEIIIATCVLNAISGILPIEREKLPRDTIAERDNSLKSDCKRIKVFVQGLKFPNSYSWVI